MWKLRVTVVPKRLMPAEFEFQTSDDAWMFVQDMLENGLRFKADEGTVALIPVHCLGPFEVWEEPD